MQFEGTRIVGFRVEPFSITHSWDETVPFDKDETTLSTCNEMAQAVCDLTPYGRCQYATDTTTTTSTISANIIATTVVGERPSELHVDRFAH